MADNREYVYRRLRQELGLTPAQAAGVVGGLGGESGKTLSTTARNPSSGAFGIGQWLGGRLTSLQSKGSPTSLRTQTNHLISELKGPERGALERLRQAHSIRSATAIFVKDFERPSAGEIASSMPARLDYAREAFNQFGKGDRGGAADGAAAGGTAGGRGGSTRTTTTITPGQDFGPQRLALVQSFLEDKDSDVLDFAMQARQLQDIPETRTTKTVRIPGAPATQSGGGDVSAASFGAGSGPAGRRGPVAHMTGKGGEHGTSGLSGYSGVDYFAKPGSAAVAPINGVVTRLSGHDPNQGAVQGAGGPLGWSVYIKGEDGHTYFLTHMGSRTVKPGQRVRAGQKIGTVANYDKYGRPSHIHMGVSR